MEGMGKELESVKVIRYGCSLYFYDKHDQCNWVIYFYTITAPSFGEAVKYFSDGSQIGAVENIFSLTKEPYLTLLLFNVDLLTQVYETE